MSRFLITSLVVSLFVFVSPQDVKRLEMIPDPKNDSIIVRVPPTQISGPKDRYHSLAFSINYSHLSKFPSPPETVNFELVSVVTARRLNTDLYVLFVVDGKEIHFSSNRSAIKRPVPGKPWVGERMVFLIPYEQFKKLAEAKTLSVKLGGVTFDFDEEMRKSIRAIAHHMLMTLTN
jgi:hypothetical protein